MQREGLRRGVNVLTRVTDCSSEETASAALNSIKNIMETSESAIYQYLLKRVEHVIKAQQNEETAILGYVGGIWLTEIRIFVKEMETFLDSQDA